MPTFPVLMHTALDATDCRELAEFYRAFLGLRYRPGDEQRDADGADWLVLVNESGQRVLAFNQVEALARPTWPTDEIPKQMHQDFRVSSVAELQEQRRRAEELGAVVLYDRSDEESEPLYVLADPAGHPFCVLVSAGLARSGSRLTSHTLCSDIPGYTGRKTDRKVCKVNASGLV